jgi:hypothetical protein
MEQSPSLETNSLQNGHKIPRVFWKPVVHYPTHTSPSMVPILSQMNPTHDLKHYFFQIHFNIIRISTPAPSKFSG